MKKDNNLKLDGTYSLEKSNDKAYKKVAYSYEFKDTKLKYFVYIPVSGNKPDSYYVGEAKKEVEEAYKNKKLLKYSKKYYNDVMHHTRKVVIVSSVSFVVVAALLCGGHVLYKKINGWNEISADEYKTLVEKMNTHMSTMELPSSGKMTLPSSFVYPETKFEETTEEAICNISYDSSKCYVEIEEIETDKDNVVTYKGRDIYGAQQSSDENSDKLKIYEGWYEYKSDAEVPEISKNRLNYEPLSEKTFDNYEDAYKELLNHGPIDDYEEESETTFSELIRSFASGIQFVNTEGYMDQIYGELSKFKDKVEGTAVCSKNYYTKKAEGSLKIVIKFNVDGTSKENSNEIPSFESVKGSGEVVCTINNYLFTGFSSKINLLIDADTDPVEIKKDINYKATHNNNDIYREDWKSWTLEQ